MEIDVYTIDNKDYLLIDKIQQFLYLSNAKDDEDMMIRKIDETDETLLLPLENDEEFEKALLLLMSKKLQETED